jgi:hypothetical protein
VVLIHHCHYTLVDLGIAPRLGSLVVGGELEIATCLLRTKKDVNAPVLAIVPISRRSRSFRLGRYECAAK